MTPPSVSTGASSAAENNSLRLRASIEWLAFANAIPDNTRSNALTVEYDRSALYDCSVLRPAFAASVVHMLSAPLNPPKAPVERFDVANTSKLAATRKCTTQQMQQLKPNQAGLVTGFRHTRAKPMSKKQCRDFYHYYWWQTNSKRTNA
jgi:hypothetical protein